jgi:coproporphyrinogen III oxidase-like Fe-S oxidoreductase
MLQAKYIEPLRTTIISLTRRLLSSIYRSGGTFLFFAQRQIQDCFKFLLNADNFIDN